MFLKTKTKQKEKRKKKPPISTTSCPSSLSSKTNPSCHKSLFNLLLKRTFLNLRPEVLDSQISIIYIIFSSTFWKRAFQLRE